MKKKISYHTNYASHNILNGYVMAEVHTGYFSITERQYNRCYKNLTIGGVCPVFHTEKPLYVMENGNFHFECAVCK